MYRCKLVYVYICIGIFAYMCKCMCIGIYAYLLACMYLNIIKKNILKTQFKHDSIDIIFPSNLSLSLALLSAPVWPVAVVIIVVLFIKDIHR